MTEVLLDDVLTHIDRALRGMRATLAHLGDERANRRPELDGANSPYVIVRHCLGVMEFWGGQVIGCRTVDRDRDAEFMATGDVHSLLTLMSAQRARLDADLADFDGAAAPRGPMDDRERDDLPEFTRTQGGVLLHLYEELAQHRGHLDLTADLVMRPTRR